jgi:hypothetical protein
LDVRISGNHLTFSQGSTRGVAGRPLTTPQLMDMEVISQFGDTIGSYTWKRAWSDYQGFPKPELYDGRLWNIKQN